MMDALIARIRAEVLADAPSLLSLFDTMAGEARFARGWLDADIARLTKGAAILEVGGGICLLSCLLASEGFSVTVIEPTGDGFGEFDALREIVLRQGAEQGGIPHVVRCFAEDFTAQERYDFACSVNVMEHVQSPAQVIARVADVLNAAAHYRFFCPNYAFPYEPHFNIPTIGSKALTQRLFAHKIFNNTRMHNPTGVWQSLNWITVRKLRRIMASEPRLSMRCNPDILSQMLERVTQDEAFAARRSGWMVKLIRGLVVLRLHRLASLMPVCLQPVMDVRLIKSASLTAASGQN